MPVAFPASTLSPLLRAVLVRTIPFPSISPLISFFQLSLVPGKVEDENYSNNPTFQIIFLSPAIIFSANSLFLGSALNANSLAGFPSGIL
jgi:hypothetical protein